MIPHALTPVETPARCHLAATNRGSRTTGAGSDADMLPNSGRFWFIRMMLFFSSVTYYHQSGGSFIQACLKTAPNRPSPATPSAPEWMTLDTGKTAGFRRLSPVGPRVFRPNLEASSHEESDAFAVCALFRLWIVRLPR